MRQIFGQAGFSVSQLTVIICLSLLLFTNTAGAFFPWDWRESLFGRGGESHEKQTRQVYDELVKEFWRYIKTATGSMRQARATWAEANGNVDGDQNHSAKHFDGENFAGGQHILTGDLPEDGSILHSTDDPNDYDLFHKIIDALKAGNGDVARTQLGKAFHTIQDFYSHSNWIEMNGPRVHDGVGRPTRSIQHAGPNDTTCKACGPHVSSDADAVCKKQCDLNTPDNIKKAGHDMFGPWYDVITSSLALASIANPVAMQEGQLAFEGIVAKLCQDGCVCDSCGDNLINNVPTPKGLTSGYYHGEDLFVDSPGKCRHGGHFDNPDEGVPFGLNNLLGSIHGYLTGLRIHGTHGINKDSLDCSWSSHGPLFHRDAVLGSREGSKQFVRDINATGITDQQLKLLFGIGPTLAFVIDTTGSMEDVISSVREQAISIVDQRKGTEDAPSRYVLVPYNDPLLDPDSLLRSITQTPDPDVFKAAINRLGASGGEDCPEPAMGALAVAINVMDSGSNILLFTDASAKDADLAPTVFEAAREKGISINVFEFESECSADSGYSTVARGSYYSLSRSDVSTAPRVMDALVRANFVKILTIEENPGAYAYGARRLLRRGTFTYPVPVDSFMEQITFQLSGSLSIDIKRPDGSSVGLADPGVKYLDLSGAKFVTIPSPAAGNFTLAVSGVSDVQLTRFDFAAYKGRPDHSGWGPTDDPPTIGEDRAVLAFMDGNFTTTHFDVRSSSGDVLSNLTLVPSTGDFGDPPTNSFFGIVNLPPGSSLIYVTGEDVNGKPYQRVIPSFLPSFPSNATINGTLPLNGTSFSAPYKFPNATSTPLGGAGSVTKTDLVSLPAEDGEGDTLTVVTTTFVTTCPVTTTIVSGDSSILKTLEVKSTMTVTSTSMLPCKKCSGPNYPSASTYVPTGAGPGSAEAISTEVSPAPTSSPGSFPGGYTTYVVVTTLVTTCPVVKTITTNSVVEVQSTYVLSTTIISSTLTSTYPTTEGQGHALSGSLSSQTAQGSSPVTIIPSAAGSPSSPFAPAGGPPSGVSLPTTEAPLGTPTMANQTNAYTGPRATGGANALDNVIMTALFGLLVIVGVVVAM